MIKQNEHCDSLQVLKEAKLSRTPQRVAVLNMLINADRPLTIIYIFKKISCHKKIDKATVYRILSSFMKKGIVRSIPTGEGINYYEMACRHNPVHAHFYCRACKKMFCLDPITFFGAWDFFQCPDGFKFDDLSVNITGLCRDCQIKK